MSRNASSTLGMIVLGGILGDCVGMLLGYFISTPVMLHTLFTKSFSFELNLLIVIISVSLNILGIIGMVLGLYYSK